MVPGYQHCIFFIKFMGEWKKLIQTSSEKNNKY
jgi:hypothetical protein